MHHGAAPAADRRADRDPAGAAGRRLGRAALANAEQRPAVRRRDAAPVRAGRGGAWHRAGEIAGAPDLLAGRAALRIPLRGRRGESAAAAAGAAGAARGWRGAIPAARRSRCASMLAHELTLIGKLKYEPYFLTVHDIVAFARSPRHPVPGARLGGELGGLLLPGRHRRSAPRSAPWCSSASSREARDEPPDIDVDFEHERREEVIQHIYDTLRPPPRGALRHGDPLPRQARDPRGGQGHGPVRGHAVGAVVAALGVLLDRRGRGPAAARDRARPERPAAGADHGADRRDHGFPRHLSQHVGGFVITEGRLDELVPVENAAMEDRTVIYWDKDDIDALGILKVDVLALGMLTCIRKAFDLMRAAPPHRLHAGHRAARGSGDLRHAVPRPIRSGVFQVESRAQMNFLPRMRPRCFYDLVIEVAIIRPGPIQGDMVHPYHPPPERGGAGANSPRTRWARCWARRWACRCSRSRRCRSPSSAPGFRRRRPTGCAGRWPPSRSTAMSANSATGSSRGMLAQRL